MIAFTALSKLYRNEAENGADGVGGGFGRCRQKRRTRHPRRFLPDFWQSFAEGASVDFQKGQAKLEKSLKIRIFGRFISHLRAAARGTAGRPLRNSCV